MGSVELNQGPRLPDQQYLLGYSEDEELRLMRQADELRPESARLLDRTGVGGQSGD